MGIETLLAAVLAVILVLTHQRCNRVLFARSWSLWLYAFPLILAIALPFHYNMVLPVFLYMVWTTVSVFWQDYLTFGLPQSYLGRRLPTWGSSHRPRSSSGWGALCPSPSDSASPIGFRVSRSYCWGSCWPRYEPG